jgi:hypothetical protein
LSDQGGLITAFVKPVAEMSAAHARSAPHEKRETRACWGAFFLTWCAYSAHDLGPLADFAFTSSPAFQWAWWVCAALGAIWLLVAFRSSVLGPFDIMQVLWSAARIGGCAWLLWSNMYPSDDAFAGADIAAYLLKGFYIALIAADLAPLVIVLMRLGGGSARKMVEDDIAANDLNWENE